MRLIDDDDSPADLSVADAKHIAFSLPIEITAQIPNAPDPSLAQVTLRSTIVAPGALATWTGDDGEPVLGIDFTGIAPADVTVPSVDGLPQLDASRFEAAIHTKYDAIPHSYALGGNTLNLYDGSRDTTLSPPNGPGNPAITATLDPPGPNQFLNVSLPLHADVPQAFFQEYGTAAFSRPVTQGDGSVSVDMGAPDDAAHPTTITFVGGHPAESLVKAQLTPLLVQRLAAFGKITEPWFTEAFAKTVLAQEAASYLAGRKYPMYTPKSGDPDHPVTTPVGFLLPADGVLAILMTLRSGTVDDATAPDNFLGSDELALAVGRAKLDETIHTAIDQAFPGIESGNSDLHTEHGDATLHSLTVTPSNPGDHGQSEGHLWAEGTATVHIPCWPDPDVSFDGPIFLHLDVTETDTDLRRGDRPRHGRLRRRRELLRRVRRPDHPDHRLDHAGGGGGHHRQGRRRARLRLRDQGGDRDPGHPARGGGRGRAAVVPGGAERLDRRPRLPGQAAHPPRRHQLRGPRRVRRACPAHDAGGGLTCPRRGVS